MFDRIIVEERLLDAIQLSLGYTLTYYRTVDENMYKEWMNEKRTKKDFRIHKDDDEKKKMDTSSGWKEQGGSETIEFDD